MSKNAVKEKGTGQRRAYALDALRGIAILMMVLVSVEPTGVKNSLPAYMYHAQVGPPFFKFIQNPGVTWVDMVLPFFLFSMGAAIPFAMTRRMEKGTPLIKLVGATLQRGLILGLFAIYVMHIRTGFTDLVYPSSLIGSTFKVAMIGLVGFLLLFPILSRLPETWKPWMQWAVRLVGWGGAIALMFIVRYKDPGMHTFSMQRNDVIILILTNVAVYTTLIYLITRTNLLFRLGFLGILMALRLSEGVPGWTHSFVANFPIPYISSLGFLGATVTEILKTINSFLTIEIAQYLFVSIPGTIIGDMILKWMREPATKESERQTWSRGRFAGLAAMLFGTTVLCLTLLMGRHVWQLAVALIPVLLILNWLVRKPGSGIENLMHNLFKWGAYLLILGMFFEPYEGGIKKDSCTMSYYFVAGGLAVFTLMMFSVIIDVFKKQRAVQLLIDNGQNPMIAYTAHGEFIGPILTLAGFGLVAAGKMISSPWLGFAYGVGYVLLVAITVSFCTRKGIFWRT